MQAQTGDPRIGMDNERNTGDGWLLNPRYHESKSRIRRSTRNASSSQIFQAPFDRPPVLHRRSRNRIHRKAGAGISMIQTNTSSFLRDHFEKGTFDIEHIIKQWPLSWISKHGDEQIADIPTPKFKHQWIVHSLRLNKEFFRFRSFKLSIIKSTVFPSFNISAFQLSSLPVWPHQGQPVAKSVKEINSSTSEDTKTRQNYIFNRSYATNNKSSIMSQTLLCGKELGATDTLMIQL